MSSRERVNVIVLGVGGVGRCFLSQLSRLDVKQLTGRELGVILISRSSRALYDQDFKSLNLTKWETDLESSDQAVIPLDQLVERVRLSDCPGPVVLVDNTSDQEVADSYSTLLKKGFHIVTPNKKAFSASYDRWEEIVGSAGKNGHGMVFHESTVGAGLPIVSTLTELVATGDEIRTIEGVFSGTMSFLFNNFMPVGGGGGRFSEEVKKAKALGYTEPDPREDLNGLDVARKLTITARLSGLIVQSPTSFPVQSLIPGPLEHARTADDFLSGLPEHDHSMDALKQKAEAAGKVLRYVGRVDVKANTLKVGLEEFDVSHPIAALKGSDNIISFYTKRYGDNALIIQGAGAGGDVTAMGVVGDLIKLLHRLH